MKRLLAPGHRAAVHDLASTKTLLAFDFDGTLAPIVADRSVAEMRPSTAALLARTCALYPCAVISGRSVSDVTARLGGAAVRYVSGNHGLEPGRGLEAFARECAQVRALLEDALAEATGVEVEDKGFSLAVHYRHAPAKRAARTVIQRAIASLAIPVRVVAGKLVVNVVPADAPHKGDALLQLRALEGADVAFYIGDDVTDEDVFALDEPGRLVTARIGAAAASRAMYFLRNQAEIDALLATFITLREGGSAARAAAAAGMTVPDSRHTRNDG